MNKLLSTFLALSVLPIAAGRAAPPPAVERVRALAEGIRKDVIAWRHHLHAHPELSNRERKTARYVAKVLRGLGVDELKTGVAKHGVVALIKGKHPGPTVAVRGDMDALPVTEQTGLAYASKNKGVMHACGHDGHTSMVLGAAALLVKLRDLMHGSVKLLFQPAEEGAPPGEKGGALYMIEGGVLEAPEVSAIFALHVTPHLDTGTIGYAVGPMMASVDRLRIEVRGKQVHAAYPWDGVDPVVAAAHIVTAIQTVTSRRVDTRDPVVISIGSVHGGERWNIIPEAVVLEGTLRTHGMAVRTRVLKTLRSVVAQTAAAHGATASLSVEIKAPVLRNHPDLVARSLPALRAAAGADRVREIRTSMGGEDFGFYAQKIPGLLFRLGMRNPAIDAVHPLHTPRFRLDDEGLLVGVRAFVLMALSELRP